MGKRKNDWQDTDYILGMFSKQRSAARRKYRDFVQSGIEVGRRPELVGGGLIRSIGGWKAAKALAKGHRRLKGDERILGDTDFLSNVLSRCEEQYERGHKLAARGIDLRTMASHVADMYDLKSEELFVPGRYHKRVQARSLLFFWAVRELGLTATELAKKTGLTQPAVSISVKRGEQIAKENNFSIDRLLR